MKLQDLRKVRKCVTIINVRYLVRKSIQIDE
jgi:hypothetical protein